jgi:predicted nuclease of predicted toxin-antitoxin system
VTEIGLGKAQDIEIWEHAASDGSVVISKDEDFVFLANRPNEQGQLVWVRLGNCRNAVLPAKFDEVHQALFAALQSGQRIIELR